MPTYQTPKRATAYKLYVGLTDQSNTKVLKANPTIAAGDFKVSKDGGAFANLTTLPSVNPAGGTAVMIDLSATEMTADSVVVSCIDAAGAEWCDLLITLQPTVRQLDDLAYPATSGRSIVVDAAGLVDANTVKVGPTGSGTAQTATDLGGNSLKVGVALPDFIFLMTDSTTHNPAPSKTVTVTRSINGAAFAATTAGTATELSDGHYFIDLSAADMGGKNVTLLCTATGCDALSIGLVLDPA